ncbi:MAG: hypothetical protein MK179_11355 [Pirellulaceae bacterium]|nr:hypothetical protein [Pirellulaceae bacterium]
MNWGVVNEVFMILQIRSLRWFLGLVMGSLFLAGATGSPLQVGSDKQLFFDDRFIAESDNVKIVMNQPRKLGPVLKPDRRWEDFRFTSYFTVLQEGDLCRMYYSCFSEDQWNFAEAAVTWRDYAFLCYAESNDGIHWRKPNLGIVEYNGSKDNNIIARSIVDGTVFIDPQAGPECRYKLLHTVGPHAGGLRISTSADGIHFELAEKPMVPWEPDSQQNMFYDDRIKKYVAYLRADRELMNIDVDWGEWRMVMRCEVNDPENWSDAEPHIVFRPDEDDPPDVDFYTNACVLYPWAANAYFMFPAAYHHFPKEYGNDGLLDISAAVSRDGIHWLRPDRGPYVPLGAKGEWDAMFNMMGVGLVRQGDKILQYYNAVDFGHGATRGESLHIESAQGRRRWGWMGATEQRLDGFYSADAAYAGGSMTTPSLTFSGNHLELNIDTSAAGSAQVELRNSSGQAIHGFTLEDCDVIMTNDVRHRVSWKGNADVSSLAGTPVQLHLKMRSTKLYAFQFVDH